MIFSHQHQQKKIPTTVKSFLMLMRLTSTWKNPLFKQKVFHSPHTQQAFPGPARPSGPTVTSPMWCATYTPPCPWRWLRCVRRSGFIRCFRRWAERWVTAWKFFVLPFSSEWQEKGHKIRNIFLLFSLRVLLELVGPVISNHLRQRHSKSLGNKFCNNNNKPLVVTKHLIFI